MSNQHIIRLVDGEPVWLAPGRPPRPLDSPAAREALRAVAAQPRSAVIFAAPGQDVRLESVAVAPEERRHLRRLLPYRLEEDLAEDVAETHFAMRMPERSLAAVALCSHAKMQQWQALLQDLPVSRWVPEPLLLPWRAGEWSLVVEDDRVLVRDGCYTGLAIEGEVLTVLLQALLAQAEQAPHAVVVYGSDQAADLALLPGDLHGRAQWRRGDLSSALLLGGAETAGPDLLQGHYAPRLPLRRWWRQWRVAAAALVSVVALHLGVTYAEVQRLEHRNLQLRQAVQAAYRSVNPRGAVVNPEKQLADELARLRGGGVGTAFVALFDKVAAALAQRDDVRIVSVNYNQGTEQMRLNLTADGYQSVETVRSAMAQAGLAATMESSSARDGGVRARLRIGG